MTEIYVMALDVSNKPLFIGSSFVWTTDLSKKKWDSVVSTLVLENTILKFFYQRWVDKQMIGVKEKYDFQRNIQGKLL